MSLVVLTRAQWDAAVNPPNTQNAEAVETKNGADKAVLIKVVFRW